MERRKPGHNCHGYCPQCEYQGKCPDGGELSTTMVPLKCQCCLGLGCPDCNGSGKVWCYASAEEGE